MPTQLNLVLTDGLGYGLAPYGQYYDSVWNDSLFSRTVPWLTLDIRDFTGNGKTTDNFNRANGTLGGNWLPSGSGVGIQIVNNAAGSALQNTVCWAIYIGNTNFPNASTTPDQYSEATFLNLSSASEQYVLARYDFSTGNYGYLFGYKSSVNGGKYYLSWHNANDVELVIATTQQIPVVGDTVRLVVVPSAGGGNTLYAYVNGVLLLTANDVNVSAVGVPGFRVVPTVAIATSFFDNWSGGPISSLSLVATNFPDNVSSNLSLILTDSLSWLDSVSIVLVNTSTITLALSDILAFSDAIIFQIGLIVLDVLSLSDNYGSSLLAFTGTLTLVLSDINGGGYGLLPYSDAGYGSNVNWGDGFTFGFGGINLVFSDSNTSWTDNLGVSIGLIVIDSILFVVDIFALAQPELEIVSDSMVLSDFVTTTFSFSGPNIRLGLQDSSSIVDAVGLGVGNSFAEQIVLSDNISVNALTLILSDAITVPYSQVPFGTLGYGLGLQDGVIVQNVSGTLSPLILSDNLNNWDDSGIAIAAIIGIAITELASINWQDLFNIVSAIQFSESLVLSDEFFGQLIQTSPTLLLSDSLVQSATFLLTSSIESKQNDSLQVTDVFQALLSWILIVNEQLTLSDSSSSTFTDIISDSLFVSDLAIVTVAMQMAVSDQLVFADAVTSEIDLKLSDDESSNYSDQIDSFIAPSSIVFVDQLTLLDSFTYEYDAIIAESLVQADKFNFSYIQFGNFSEAINLSDSVTLSVSYELMSSDQNLFTDLETQQYTFQMNFQDIPAGWLDAIVLIADFRVAVGDNLNLWQEFISELQNLSLAVQDDGSTSWVEQLVVALQATLSQVDNGSANWNDSYTQQLAQFLPGALADDNGANWLDQIMTFFGPGLGPVSVQAIQVSLRVVVGARANVNTE